MPFVMLESIRAIALVRHAVGGGSPVQESSREGAAPAEEAKGRRIEREALQDTLIG